MAHRSNGLGYEWLTDAAKWCSGGWQSGSVNLSALFEVVAVDAAFFDAGSRRSGCKGKNDYDTFAHRDGSVRLRKWLVALHGEVLMDAFKNEPGLADERNNFEEY